MKSLSSRLAETHDLARRQPWPDRPVKLTFVITDLDVGGAERALVSLATRLDRRRWAPSVICLSGEGALVGNLRREGIPCHCLAVNPRHPLLAVARVAWRMNLERPSVVQSFLFHANLSAKLAAPWAGRPWVLGGLRVAERRRNWHLTLDRLTCRASAGSICVSEGVRRLSLEVGLPDDRLCVIPNGIDPEPYDRAIPTPRESLGIPGGAHLALFVGRLDPQKGLVDLLAAAERLAELVPDWHLAIVGDGPERGWLERRLDSDSRLAGRVHCLGRRSDIPGLMKIADLLVLPSLWEGMPNVILEAMASRLPVVGTRVEGTEDLVIHGRTGWLVPPGNSTSLREALLEAAQNPSRCRDFGEAGRRLVEDAYRIDRIVADYERVWAGLLGYRYEQSGNELKPSRKLRD